MAKKTIAMSGPDAAWLRMDNPTNLMMITGVLTFDEVLTMDEVKTIVEQRLLIYNRFRQRVIDRHSTPRWEDDPYFDLDRHIHRLALPPPGDRKTLQALVSDLMNTGLHFGKPLWEMHLVENYRNGCALVSRLHHCIGDDIALIHVMMTMADEFYDPAKASLQKTSTARRGVLAPLLKPIVGAVNSTVKATGAVLHEGMEMLLSPSHLLNRTKQGLSVGAATSKLLLMGADSDTVFKGDLGATKRAVWSRPIELQTVKAIGHGVGGKVNDVLMTAVTGTLRRYLQNRNQPIEDVEIRALIPVNLRNEDNAHTLGNYFGLVFLSLPVGIADPRERLVEVKSRMDEIKHSAEAPVALGILHDGYGLLEIHGHRIGSHHIGLKFIQGRRQFLRGVTADNVIQDGHFGAGRLAGRCCVTEAQRG